MRPQVFLLFLLAACCNGDTVATGETKMSELFKIHSSCKEHDAFNRFDDYLAQTITLLDSCLKTFTDLRDESEGLDFADPEVVNLVWGAWYHWGVVDLQRTHGAANANEQAKHRKIHYGEDDLEILKIAHGHLERVQKLIQDARATASDKKKTRLLCTSSSLRKVTYLKEVADQIPSLAPYKDLSVQEHCMQ